MDLDDKRSIGVGSLNQAKDGPLDAAQGSSTRFWPRDFLPNECGVARIWTYGYDSRVAKGYGASVNKNSIFEHANDLLFALERTRNHGQPIIWVAHSLGGIIVKQVCATNIRESHYLIDENLLGPQRI